MGKLTWFPLPFGLAVTVVNFFAVREVSEHLPSALVVGNKQVAPQAVDAFIPFAQGRIALLGAVFIAAALLFGLVEFGPSRRLAELANRTRLLNAAYAATMPVIYALNPVTGYDEQFPDPSGSHAAMPFDMGALSPPWYLPLLGLILAIAAIAQLLAVHDVVGDDLVLLPSSPRSAWLLLLPLTLLVAFAAANLVADGIARATAPPVAFREGDHALDLMLHVCAIAAVPAAALALHGIILRRHGLRPRSMLIVGVFTGFYLFTLLLVAWGNLVMYTNGELGFAEHLPGWREEVTAGILGAAVLVQLTALPLLARLGTTRTTGAEPGG